jgi:hypothetical protein
MRRRCPFMSDMLEWHARSSEGRQNMEYKIRGHLGMMRTDENAETDCCLDIIMITVEFNADKTKRKTNFNNKLEHTKK